MRLPVHPARLVPAQEGDYARDLVWLTDAFLWVQVCEELHELLAFALHEQLGLYRARRDRVHCNAAGAEVLGQDAHHLLDSALRRGVEHVVGRAP